MHTFSVSFKLVDVYVDVCEALANDGAMVNLAKLDLVYLDVRRRLNEFLSSLEECIYGSLRLDESTLLADKHNGEKWKEVGHGEGIGILQVLVRHVYDLVLGLAVEEELVEGTCIVRLFLILDLVDAFNCAFEHCLKQLVINLLNSLRRIVGEDLAVAASWRVEN